MIRLLQVEVSISNATQEGECDGAESASRRTKNPAQRNQQTSRLTCDAVPRNVRRCVAIHNSESNSEHGIPPTPKESTSHAAEGTSKDVHRTIKTNFASYLCSKVKSLAKVHASRVGGTHWSRKPMMMMLDHKKTEANTVSHLDLGTMVNNGFVYRQNIYIRSYEIGPDRKASIETLLNHLQETSLNHMKTIGILHDGYALTPEMCKKNLIWVVAKMQVEVDHYPVWGDVVQIDTWKAAYGKIGMYCNWVVSDSTTSDILLRASCVWVMMNKVTRRTSKIPNEVRAELDQHLVNTPPIVKHGAINLSKRDENITHNVSNGLTPRWSDLDVNHHVNNVKYSGWILESVPKTIMKEYELASMTLEYSQECWMDSVLQSHTFVNETENGKTANCSHVDCEHLLQLENGGGNGVIMKGRTRWRLKDGEKSGEKCVITE